MDTPQQYPTMWTTGYLANGMKVSFTFPIRNEFEACKQALEITNKLLADGFLMTEPGLEAGEESEMIARVSRRSKKNSDGSISPVIDLFGAHDALKFKIISIYLDTPEDVAAFETACGIKLASLPVNPTKAAVERDDENFVVALPHHAKAILKMNPAYKEDSEDKKPKRLFVRWELVTTTQTPPKTDPTQPPPITDVDIERMRKLATPPAAAAQAGEPPRNARLENEELVITRVVKTGMVTGNPDPDKNGAKYDGWGKIVDGGTFDVRVWIYPEDVTKILDAGYGFNEGSDNHIPIIMDTTDRAMTRIGQVVPKNTGNADFDALGTENGQSGETVNSFVTNKLQNGKPVLIFKYGDNYAYSYTREPFRVAGYNVDGWDVVGNHEMPTPAKLTCVWDKQHKQLIVKSADMLDVFAEAS